MLQSLSRKLKRTIRHRLRIHYTIVLTELRKQSNFCSKKCCYMAKGQVSSVLVKTDWYSSSVSPSNSSSLIIACFASLLVELEKFGSSLAELHNGRGFESNICLCTLTFGMANTPLVTCHPVLFEVKTTYLYLILFSFIMFILFLYYFYLILLFWFFCQGSVGFRVVPGRFREIPGRFRGVPGWFRVVSGRFRVVPARSGSVPRFTYTRFPTSSSLCKCQFCYSSG